MKDQSPKLNLTARDIHMLWSLSQARFLTAQALEWLHVPSWRERWQRWQQQSDRLPHYRVTTRLHTRLHRLEQAGLLLRIRRPISLAIHTFRREPDLYALTQQGADVLHEYGKVSQEDISFEVTRQRAFLTLAHSADIGRAYAALRTKIELTANLEFADWQGDHITAQGYDRIAVRVPKASGAVVNEQLPVQPDGTFRLLYSNGSIRCFVEVDRGRPVPTWVDKIRAYQAYEGSPELNGRYGVQSFMLLALTISATQRQKIMEATAQVLGQPNDRYLFGLIEEIHPFTIGDHWLKILEVTPTIQRLPTGNTIQRTSITTAPHTFIR